MAFIPPPCPLTREQFEERIKSGARTMQEIDPAFYEWLEATKPPWGILIYGSIVAIILGIIMGFII